MKVGHQTSSLVVKKTYFLWHENTLSPVWTRNIQSIKTTNARQKKTKRSSRGKQAFRRTIKERDQEYPNYENEFGHIEGDTIVGKHHKSAVITLVERVSKCIITIKPEGRKAQNIEESLNDWFQSVPKNLFKSIIFDCGKEFSNWKNVSNEQDIDIYFADPGTLRKGLWMKIQMGCFEKADYHRKWISIQLHKNIFPAFLLEETIFPESH